MSKRSRMASSKSSLPIGEDVDFDAVEDCHSWKLLAQQLDVVALVRDIVARERARRGRARRMVGDGATYSYPSAWHPASIDFERVAAITVSRVHVQVAAHVGGLDEDRKRPVTAASISPIP